VYTNIATRIAGMAAHTSLRSARDLIFRRARRTPRQTQYNCEEPRIRRMIAKKDIGKENQPRMNT